jgi:hypothetical protein
VVKDLRYVHFAPRDELSVLPRMVDHDALLPSCPLSRW